MDWVRLGDQLYKMGKVMVLCHQPQPKTQPQHTTTNMSDHQPTHQQLWSSLSMATSSMALDVGAAAPYGSLAGAGPRASGALLPLPVPLIGAPE